MAELIATVAEERLWIGTVPPVDVDARATRIAAALTSGASTGFVIERDGRILGELTLYGRDPAGIAMCLDASVRGRGFGGTLLDAALGYAWRIGHPVVELGVYTHNRAARRLYASRGFVPVGEPTSPTRLDGESYEILTLQRRIRRSVHR